MIEIKHMCLINKVIENELGTNKKSTLSRDYTIL